MSTKEKTDPGLAIIKRAMAALSDPTADARIAAAEEAKEHRQSLVILGHRSVNKPDKLEEELLRDIDDLRWYLQARKSKETDEGLTISLKVGDELKTGTVQWHADRGEISFSCGGDTQVVKTNKDGLLSTLTVEAVLANLIRAAS